MTGRGEAESYEALVKQLLVRTGLLVTLDKGFRSGDYCVFMEYDELSDRIGFTAARRQALDYCARLRGQLAGAEGCRLEAIEDASQSGGPGRKRDLESTFLSFGMISDDGIWHDAVMKEQFRFALLRANQERDQVEAREDTRRRHSRRERFQQRLDTLLAGEPYRHVDAATRERLLAEVTALAFPPKGRGL